MMPAPCSATNEWPGMHEVWPMSEYQGPSAGQVTFLQCNLPIYVVLDLSFRYQANSRFGRSMYRCSALTCSLFLGNSKDHGETL
jgi:hypothetical protein